MKCQLCQMETDKNYRNQCQAGSLIVTVTIRYASCVCKKCFFKIMEDFCLRVMGIKEGETEMEQKRRKEVINRPHVSSKDAGPDHIVEQTWEDRGEGETFEPKERGDQPRPPGYDDFAGSRE